MLFNRATRQMVEPASALPGRAVRPYSISSTHTVLGTPLEGPWPAGLEVAYFGMGCFWGAERLFWKLPGVYSTAVGYAGGYTVNPSYEETCTGRTGHTEAVQVVYDPALISFESVAKVFWEGHNPTQGFRQGNDQGTQYRSVAYWTTDAQAETLLATKSAFEPVLARSGYGAITTELAPAPVFYYAEDYHQQYLEKVPNGYCGLGGTGASCPIGVARTDG